MRGRRKREVKRLDRFGSVVKSPRCVCSSISDSDDKLVDGVLEVKGLLLLLSSAGDLQALGGDEEGSLLQVEVLGTSLAVQEDAVEVAGKCCAGGFHSSSGGGSFLIRAVGDDCASEALRDVSTDRLVGADKVGFINLG